MNKSNNIVKKRDSKIKNTSECIICIENCFNYKVDIKDVEHLMIKIDPCNHEICLNCLTKLQKFTCPQCRVEINLAKTINHENNNIPLFIQKIFELGDNHRRIYEHKYVYPKLGILNNGAKITFEQYSKVTKDAFELKYMLYLNIITTLITLFLICSGIDKILYTNVSVLNIIDEYISFYIVCSTIIILFTMSVSIHYHIYGSIKQYLKDLLKFFLFFVAIFTIIVKYFGIYYGKDPTNTYLLTL